MTLSIYKNVWHLLKRYPGSYIPGPHIFYCSNLKIQEEEKWGSFYPFSGENNQLESSDMIRLFEMMEKFGDRIKFIENQL